MALSQNIPILRASIFEPFLVAAREAGVPIEKYLRWARLPSLSLDGPDMLLPEVPCWRFLERVATAEGIDTYGLTSASTIKHPELSSLAPLVAGCSNLGVLLRRFCNVAPLVSNSVHYTLQIRGRTAWLTNCGRRLLLEDVHAQLFQILGMIQLIQLAAGPTWRPPEVHFSIPYRAAIQNAPELNPSRIHFMQSHPAISFPIRLLAMPLIQTPERSSALEPIPESFSEQLAKLLLPYLGFVELDKAIAAEITGFSDRTLQRRLAREGSSFSQVIDQMRCQKACGMLAESDSKLIDISLFLGYKDAPSFSRAFRRWCGLSPREYRRQLAQR